VFCPRLLGERIVVVRVEGLARLVPDAEVGAAVLRPAVRRPRLLGHLHLLAADHLAVKGHRRRVVVRRARGIGVLLLCLDDDGLALLDRLVLVLLDDDLLGRGLGLLGGLGLLLGRGRIRLRLLLGGEARAHALTIALRGRALLGRRRLPGRVDVGRVELDDLVGGRLIVALLLEAARDGEDRRLDVLLGIHALLDRVANDLDERVPGSHGGRQLLLDLLLAIVVVLLRGLLGALLGGGGALEVARHGGGELLLLLEVEGRELLEDGVDGGLNGGHLGCLGASVSLKFLGGRRKVGGHRLQFFFQTGFLALCSRAYLRPLQFFYRIEEAFNLPSHAGMGQFEKKIEGAKPLLT